MDNIVFFLLFKVRIVIFLSHCVFLYQQIFVRKKKEKKKKTNKVEIAQTVATQPRQPTLQQFIKQKSHNHNPFFRCKPRNGCRTAWLGPPPGPPHHIPMYTVTRGLLHSSSKILPLHPHPPTHPPPTPSLTIHLHRTSLPPSSLHFTSFPSFYPFFFAFFSRAFSSSR